MIVDKNKNKKRNRYYGLRIGDIVSPISFNREWDKGKAIVIGYNLMDNNSVYIKALSDGTETKWVAEHCVIVTKVEDK